MIEVQKSGEKVEIRLSGDLVASSVDELKIELKDIIAESPKKITINMDKVEMVDSMGLGVMIATQNSLANKEGVLEVINLSPNIYGLFKTMRLDKHFTVVAK